jgi:hypothetical protein
MNCRTFHRNLEDYLEDGLDFPGRFGMERHAQQCIGCGKVMADAQRIGQMTRELKRVKAPSNFEEKLLEEIGKHKSNRRFSRFRRLWIYGFEPMPWRKLALGSASFAVLLLGLLFAFNHSFFRPLPHPKTPLQASTPPAAPLPKAETNPGIIAANSAEKNRGNKTAQKAPKKISEPQPMDIAQQQMLADQEEAGFIEYPVIGPDNRPVIIRMPLPKEIQMQYGQPSEEYFIRNVSH